MELNGRGVNRAARRIAEQQLAKATQNIAILWREENGKRIYQWGSNNGDWYSPVFDDVWDAVTHAELVGLRKQDA